MVNHTKHTFRASIFIGLMLFLFSCSSYNDMITPYYKQMASGNYTEAMKELEKNKLLQKPRNKLLFLMEKGKTAHLMGDYENSNRYFNEADQLLENGLGGTMDAVVGTLVNPMNQVYKGEDFEKFMIHYYKALNYVYLGKPEDAIVEARRIGLQSQEQGDKFNNKDNRYSKDAFSLMLQGLIYEYDGDMNNAFIAYRNAAEVYLNSKDQTYYGTPMPEELKKDLLRTAAAMGFTAELQRFETLFKLKYTPEKAPEGGELIFFWENGLAPVKEQEEFFFSLVKGDDGSLFFTNVGGTIIIPFSNGYGSDFNVNSVQSLRATFPKYVSRPPFYSSATLTDGKTTVGFEKAEDINELAYKTLQQRFLKEMGKTLSRLAVKKSAEYVLRESSKGTGKNGKDNSLLEGLGFGVQLYSLLSEKSDTRNWQSLPASISYTRIPLQKGKNTITLNLKASNGTEETKTIEVMGTGRLQFYNYSTLR
ncbi:hypothetical protein AQ505_00120 [Pedobacter sp. PACM 27299]|uniref:COG3014 family protein n=1 Tax=Pedobacter sp. PACM 27299 TaxID=1727164 RepID=UPI0007061257|nr:hypothetical protein [Pedobacter sp. PACM 27299]ALL04034.1 hypothetical protein AQ505_00120 [Pedobacter sp. PACM 27299]